MQVKRSSARKLLFQVANALVGYPVPVDSILLLNSGRYEFRNKGIDLFIESLGQLNNIPGKPILAFIMSPGNISGPNKELLDRLQGNPGTEIISHKYLTHNLYHEEYDPVLRQIRVAGLNNNEGDRVRIIFAPAFLNGADGIFNLPYYDLLPGFDLTVFPSYYEPWGYTPLESAAYGIPTITTSVAGFGLWIQALQKRNTEAIKVINRNDSNDAEVLANITAHIQEFTLRDSAAIQRLGAQAVKLADHALWQ
jgi:phosphorylase/glycogen(starch) synthase